MSMISDYKRINKLIEKINPDGVFDFHKLKEKVRSDSFKDWLKNPINNSQFLKYLSKSMYLDVFSDEFIFLTQDGDLQRSFDLLINFDLNHAYTITT